MLIIALFDLLTLLLLWWMGNGPTQAGCCAAPIAATPMAAQTTMPAQAPAATPAPESARNESKVATEAPLPERAKTEMPKTEVASAAASE